MTFPLLPPPPSSHVDKIVPLCLPWPWCGCGGCLLDWLPSRLMPGAQCSPSIRDAPDPFVLLVSAASRRDSENLHLVFSSLKVLLLFFWSLKDLSLPQFSSRTPVWKRNSLLIQSSLHFDCVASSSTSCCRILRNSLENLHIHFKFHTLKNGSNELEYHSWKSHNHLTYVSIYLYIISICLYLVYTY